MKTRVIEPYFIMTFNFSIIGVPHGYFSYIFQNFWNSLSAEHLQTATSESSNALLRNIAFH